MKYGVILADPPWTYGNAGCRGAAANEYKTMSIDDICALPVNEIAASDSVLLLWGTWPLVPEAMRVIKSWGFSYVTGLPWIKVLKCQQNLFDEVQFSVPYGIGFWARGCSEPLFVARRGTVSPPNSGFIGLLSPNYYHSRKPDSVYEIADALPGPRLELFARRERKGWDTWGNEVVSNVCLQAPPADPPSSN